MINFLIYTTFFCNNYRKIKIFLKLQKFKFEDSLKQVNYYKRIPKILINLNLNLQLSLVNNITICLKAKLQKFRFCFLLKFVTQMISSRTHNQTQNCVI